MLALAMPWWALEALSVLSGLLPDAGDAIDAHAILFQCSALTFTAFSGLGTACSIRVGTSLGAGCLSAAKRATLAATVLACALGTLCSGFLVALRWQLPRLFIEDEVVVTLAADVLPIVAAYQVLDAVHGVSVRPFALRVLLLLSRLIFTLCSAL